MSMGMVGNAKAGCLRARAALRLARSDDDDHHREVVLSASLTRRQLSGAKSTDQIRLMTVPCPLLSIYRERK
jgi:hypothetical protein